MNSDVMDLAAFHHLLDRFGADPVRWPDDKRAAALALFDRSGEARDAQVELASIETILRIEARPSVSVDLVARRAMRARQQRPAAPAWRRAAYVAAAAAALLLGVAVGQVKDRGDPSDHMFASSIDSGDAVDVD